jgi:hypothetical protein
MYFSKSSRSVIPNTQVATDLDKGGMADLAIFLSQQITYCVPFSRTIELTDKLLKPRREKIMAQLPVMLDSGRSDVVL